ncbi:MAG: redox-regulated ATPase YchF [Eubacteriaceae bacterium]|jgi:GTP-binding protein YchF|uniref:Ribosome-binding ATPase YchF n=1 Tax=Candidatus Pseudoramibacter fermentans TaxID=2594427 RepID=A0A6L5GRX0_9FIRM|nr:redox-regulated ATPase YchF [Candidatus Pseudoramibacter fermentans]RRF93757.1 MAG: redox-regulated ATPase YchF [Eubacteriaceae bacterium]
MQIGIIGLPNVGKSTIFNAITKAGAESANYPFCTIDPNVGMVAVPDHRLDVLGKMYDTKKIVPTTIEFVDIAGLVKGASRGEGLGNKFLANIREVDAVAHVVRCFENENIVHVEGKIDPVDDVETINLELIFADLEMIDRRIDKTTRAAKGSKEAKKQLEILQRVKASLEAQKKPDPSDYSEDEWKWVSSLQMICTKPIFYIANVSEDDLSEDNDYVKKLRDYVAPAEVVKISAKIEEEISTLEDDEKQEFLEAMGMDSSGLDRVISVAYRLLGLISFLTAGPDECRAWTITKGTKAPQAAGKVHTDMERGFIKAEITSYDDLIEAGSEAKARELGLTRTEGKDYVMKDGDVTFFKFNV